MKFTVKRSEWFRGNNASNSYLRRAFDGQMCCLGFRALAAGSQIEDINGIRLPADIRINTAERTKDFLDQWKGLVHNKDGYLAITTLCTKIAMENDISVDRTPKKREANLKGLFAEIGDEIIFED